jgi:hypothetical protein
MSMAGLDFGMAETFVDNRAAEPSKSPRRVNAALTQRPSSG